MQISSDEQALRRALDLSLKAGSLSAPNPCVGCVIVKDGAIIGEGVTQRPGQAHAEIVALRDAASRGHDVRGATVYVTLEPCSHFGRTPPCADALIAAGVGRVVAAISDPNPLVGGQGLDNLRAAGIAVSSGLLAEEARESNIGFFTRMEKGRPWVRVKSAISLDGKTALASGESRWITSEPARKDGHAWRARAGALMTGIGTVQADNPQLNVRGVHVERQPLRVIVDSAFLIDPDARVFADSNALVATATHDEEKANLLRNRGVDVVVLADPNGKVDLPQLFLELGRRQINEVHVEAGARLSGATIAAGCADELLVYLAPTLLGAGRAMFDLPEVRALNESTRLSIKQVEQVGPDVRIIARFI